MKNLLLLTIILFYSCSSHNEDIPKCVEITGRYVVFKGLETNYYFITKGSHTEVLKNEYLDYRIGEIYCY